MALAPVRPMMATLASALPVGADWSYEVKWDGYRAMLVKDGVRVRLISRNLKDLTDDYPHLAAAGAAITRDNAIIDGEIVAIDEHGVPSFQALQHRSVKRTAVVFYAFDLLRHGAADYRNRPLRERREALHRLTFAPPILLSKPLPGSPQEIERAVRKTGLEGEGVTAEDMKSLRWVKPRVVLQVAFTEWTAGGNLRHASFIGLREDKPPRAVHREV